MILVALQNVPDIPEKDLVTLIGLVSDKCATGDEEWIRRFPYFLRSVVDAPHNAIFMQQALRRLNASHIRLALQTLMQWMDPDTNPDTYLNVSMKEGKSKLGAILRVHRLRLWNS